MVSKTKSFGLSLVQVQAQLLQFAAKNIGLNPALLTSPINPQHMTLLNQLYQLQLVSPHLVSSQFTLGLLHINTMQIHSVHAYIIHFSTASLP